METHFYRDQIYINIYQQVIFLSDTGLRPFKQGFGFKYCELKKHYYFFNENESSTKLIDTLYQ